MSTMQRITIYVDHVDSSADFDRVEAWLKKWKEKLLLQITALVAGNIAGILKLLLKLWQKFPRSGFVLANGRRQKYLASPNNSFNRDALKRAR
jgi:hypothetical protein